MLRLVLGLSAVCTIYGCQYVIGIEALPMQMDPSCPDAADAHAGPPLVAVRSADGSCYYIDKTEVSYGQYQSFLEAAPRPSGDASCDWEHNFVPECEDAQQPNSDTDLPVVCVSYCDAAAFCAWAGKSLCPGEHDAPTEPRRSAWYKACGGLEGRPYPYVGAHDPQRCNGADNPDTGCDKGSCSLVSSDALTGCKTEQGILHLSGNVEEWTAECNGNTGATDRCLTRGGSVNTRSLECGLFGDRQRDYRSRFTGFRCCLTE